MNEELPFGKRYGFKPVKIPFQIKEIDETLRTELWSSFFIFFYQPWQYMEDYKKKDIINFYKFCWLHFFKLPYDEYPSNHSEFIYKVKAQFKVGNWVKIYEFLEFTLETAKPEIFELDKFIQYVNRKLRDNNSAYTVVGKKLAPITNEAEIEEVEKLNVNSCTFNQLSGIKVHLKAAIEFLSNKPNPECRNSIKESISMVEVISRIIEPSENTLGKALKKLEKNNKINSIFKEALEKMYAYTNGKNGIRHAIMDEELIEVEDARYFLISCSAFTNFLIEKAKRDGLIK